MMSWMEFFHMGGYAPYVWGAYGLSVVVLVLNAVWAWRCWRRLSRHGNQTAKTTDPVS